MLADPVFDLECLSADDLAACGRKLESIGERASHRQEVAERVVRHLYNSLRIPATGEPACVLVRCFQTCPYARLPLEYQHAAGDILEQTTANRNLRCLTLLATCGSKLVWNDVATSINHQCIPLPSIEVVRRAPMIARLLEQMGVPLELIVSPPDSAEFLVGQVSGDFNVFHVEHALGSPFIPAQAEFVEPYNVRSVVGMGGLLSDGELFVVLLFARVPISHEAAELFRTLAVTVQSAFLPFAADQTFERLEPPPELSSML